MFEFVRLSKLTDTSLKDVGLVEPGVLEWLLSKRSLVLEAPFMDKLRARSLTEVPDF